MAGATLLIERSSGETRAALLDGERLLQVDHYRHHALPLDGAIFHGRIRRIEPGLNAAFVDLDGSREGFLRARAVAGRTRGAAIATLVHEGQAILVRALGEAPDEAGKLVRVATLNETERAAALGGVPAPAAPACVDAGPPPVARVLAEHAAAADLIVVNAGPVRAEAEAWLAANGGAATLEVGAGDLFAAHGVEDEIAGALEPVVTLDGGARLTVEPGRTLCAIDVDSGASAGAAGRNARDVNLAAVREIARQLRLREIGGAVVVDLLRMERQADRDAVLASLRAACADDPAECHVLGYSRLGLVELTRHRRRPSLSARLVQPVRAVAPRAEAVACALLRDLAGRTRRGEGDFTVTASSAIVALLDGPMADALAESLSWSHAGIAVRAEAGWPVARYAIESAVRDSRRG